MNTEASSDVGTSTEPGVQLSQYFSSGGPLYEHTSAVSQTWCVWLMKGGEGRRERGERVGREGGGRERERKGEWEIFYKHINVLSSRHNTL